MGTTLIPIQANLYLAMLQEDEVPSWNKTGSEFILILTMWVKDKESKIQMVKETSTRASSNQIVPVERWQWWGENFSINKIVPVHHDFNSNVEENSQELKIKFRFNSSLWSRITTIKWVLLQAVTEFNKNQSLWILNTFEQFQNLQPSGPHASITVIPSNLVVREWFNYIHSLNLSYNFFVWDCIFNLHKKIVVMEKKVFFCSCCLASLLTQQLRYFSVPTENPGTAGTYYSVSNIFYIDLVSKSQMNHSRLEKLKYTKEWSW